MNYQVADGIIQIKNAYLANRKTVVLPYAKINKSIGKLLVKNQLLADIKEDVLDGKKILVVELRYSRRKPAFKDVEIISKPSLRVYVDLKQLRVALRDQNFLVLTTSSGIISGKEAFKKKIGGEYLFKIK